MHNYIMYLSSHFCYIFVTAHSRHVAVFRHSAGATLIIIIVIQSNHVKRDSQICTTAARLTNSSPETEAGITLRQKLG